MNTEPLLSIITATYNNEPLLPRFFDSILNQTYTNWELLIINDGSTDNTLSVCYEYAARDSRIKVYTQENKGQAPARNAVLKYAKGDLLTYVDSDDAVKPDTYRAAISTLMDNPKCDIVVYPIEWINQQERFVTAYSVRPVVEDRDAMFDLLYNVQRVYPVIWDKIYRRDILDGLEFLPGVLFDDNLMFVQILTRCKGICFSLVGAYEYHQEEFDLKKFLWDERKDYSQVVVNCAAFDVLSKDKELAKYRDVVYSRICNHLYTSLPRRKEEVKGRILKYGRDTIMTHNVLFSQHLSLKQKAKAFYLKLRYMLGL